MTTAIKTAAAALFTIAALGNTAFIVAAINIAHSGGGQLLGVAIRSLAR